MIKQIFHVTVLSSSGISDSQLQRIILEKLSGYGLMDTEISIEELSEKPYVFGNDFHLENGETFTSLRRKQSTIGI